jgi:hypothetical protein
MIEGREVTKRFGNLAALEVSGLRMEEARERAHIGRGSQRRFFRG